MSLPGSYPTIRRSESITFTVADHVVDPRVWYAYPSSLVSLEATPDRRTCTLTALPAGTPLGTGKVNINVVDAKGRGVAHFWLRVVEGPPAAATPASVVEADARAIPAGAAPKAPGSRSTI